MRFFRRRISGDNFPSGVPLTKASMPPLNSMVRIAAAERRSRTGPSTSDNTEIVCKLGRKRRFVLMLEWLTLWPTWTPLPVTGHLRAISYLVQQTPSENAPRLLTAGPGRAPAVSRPRRRQRQGWRAAHRPGIVPCLISGGANDRLPQRQYRARRA